MRIDECEIEDIVQRYVEDLSANSGAKNYTDGELLAAAATVLGQQFVALALKDVASSIDLLTVHVEAFRQTYAAPDGGFIPTKI